MSYCLYVLCVTQTLSENEMHSFEFKSLQDSLDEIKAHIDPANLRYGIMSLQTKLAMS